MRNPISTNKNGMIGLEVVTKNLRKAARNAPTEVGGSMHKEMGIELVEMKARTPVESGELEGSGAITDPIYEGDNITVAVSFNTDYAVYVHEDLEAIHPVGQAKFIESVLDESAPHMSTRIGRNINMDRLIK